MVHGSWLKAPGGVGPRRAPMSLELWPMSPEQLVINKCSAFKDLEISFCSGLFPGHFFLIDLWAGISMLGTPKSRVSQGKCCEKQLFTEIAFYELWARFVSFFGGGFGSHFFCFFVSWKGKQVKIRRICNGKTNLEFGIWRGGSKGYSDPKNR